MKKPIFFNSEFYLTYFPKKFKKTILGVRGVLKDNDKYLLVKRCSADRHNANKWEFPGGSVEKNQTPLEALKREIREELNLVINKTSTSCFVTHHDIPVKHPSIYKGYRRLIMYYEIQVSSLKNIMISYEHSAYKWYTIENALKLDLTEDTLSYLKSL